MRKHDKSVKGLTVAISPLNDAAMQHRRFICLVIGICVAAYGLLIGIGRSALYCHFSHNLFDAAPCFKSGMSGIGADVLLVGDSSLLYGVRPDLVAADGGGTTYNLGMIGPSFSYQVSALIDGYLAGNKRPRAIVLYFAPYEKISHDRIADPMWAPLGIYLLRHGSWGDIAHFLTIRPSAIVEMPPIILTGLTMPGPVIRQYAAQMQLSSGFVEYARGKLALPAGCQLGSFRPPAYALGDNSAALATLRRRYQAKGLPLFVYVAPIANCDNGIDAVRQAYKGVSDNLPMALPNENFADDVPVANHVHASSAGVATFSDALAKFIRVTVQPRLGTQP